MKKLLKLLIASSLLYCSSGLVLAEEVNKEMLGVYAAFKKLQPFMAKSGGFEDPANQSEIKSLLQTISQKFHTVDEVSSRYQKEPGFNATAKLVHEMLDDSSKRFNEGNKSYALWRLRGLSTHCMTCHATYNVELNFRDKSSDIANLPAIDRANFYFSSRQFAEASKAYLEAIEKSPAQFDTIEALKKWLIVQTRVNANPKDAEKTLSLLLPKLKLPVYEQEEVQSWINSLKNWSSNKEQITGLPNAEQLIRQAVSIDPLSDKKDEVTLLRATAHLHNLLPTLKEKEDRSRALYLLGFCYNKLQSFFIDDLPEIYLRLSIEEFPGSKSAKAAFELYKEIVALSFTGSAGTDIPEDVQINLIELHKKAYNIPAFTGKI